MAVAIAAPAVSAAQVLVVEHDPASAGQHVRLLQRVPGMTVVGAARSAEKALCMLENLRPDLMLLELDLPGVDGLTLLRRVRSSGCSVEAIVMSDSREARVVRACAQLGVLDYLIQPFQPDRLNQALGTFRQRARMPRDAHLDQTEIDHLIASGRSAQRWLPKELQKGRLEQIRSLVGAGSGLSAADAAQAAGISRVTARRYLEYLVTNGAAVVDHFVDGPGRPQKVYRPRELAW
jgi:response regulator of citrate/malate metabolism